MDIFCVLFVSDILLVVVMLLLLYDAYCFFASFLTPCVRFGRNHWIYELIVNECTTQAAAAAKKKKRIKENELRYSHSQLQQQKQIKLQ